MGGGPLTRAVREGAICYLDEIVEARQDTTVVLHPLADHRRQMPIDRLGVTLDAAEGFCLVVSYNPGYQSVLKDLKDSTRQRMVAIELDFPPADVEEKIVADEAGVDADTAAQLVRLAQAIRRLESAGLREVASTRVLVAAGRLVAEGLPHAGGGPGGRGRSADRRPDLTAGLVEMIDAYLTPNPVSPRLTGRRRMATVSVGTNIRFRPGSRSSGPGRRGRRVLREHRRADQARILVGLQAPEGYPEEARRRPRAALRDRVQAGARAAA